MRLVDEYADAMRVGSPGPCYAEPPSPGIRDTPDRWHVLDGDAVRHLRTASAGGGIAFCERCGVAIFVPGNPDAGVEIPVRRGDHWGSTLVTDRKPRFDVEKL